MCSYTRAENEISKGQFPRVSRRGLHLGKEIYKLKSGLAIDIFSFVYVLSSKYCKRVLSCMLLVANRFSGHLQIGVYFYQN